ncbi:hypothetical protein N7532_007964 [Penicillium argentinense]|uniref:Uncharacterized protein n=1 Tax=Penicillium argentinense TaxID=1131581 RepID=A0A9W9K1E9_9EURO|nr:uncharacterized protein N7532_007964 [Penicillium argentinense]KAJ5089280.1 hypothetical protein N7532_007964 [Penicillium argentinense]
MEVPAAEDSMEMASPYHQEQVDDFDIDIDLMEDHVSNMDSDMVGVDDPAALSATEPDMVMYDEPSPESMVDAENFDLLDADEGTVPNYEADMLGSDQDEELVEDVPTIQVEITDSNTTETQTDNYHVPEPAETIESAPYVSDHRTETVTSEVIAEPRSQSEAEHTQQGILLESGQTGEVQAEQPEGTQVSVSNDQTEFNEAAHSALDSTVDIAEDQPAHTHTSPLAQSAQVTEPDVSNAQAELDETAHVALDGTDTAEDQQSVHLQTSSDGPETQVSQTDSASKETEVENTEYPVTPKPHESHESHESHELEHQTHEPEYENPEDESLHPVKVLYQDNEISLFPPLAGDSAETFFLHDEEIGYDNVGRLFSCFRDVLGDNVAKDEVLVIDIDALGIQITEDSQHTSKMTLQHILDIYVRLSYNDGITHPDPLYLTLTSKISSYSELAGLDSAANEGKGLSQIHAWDVDWEDEGNEGSAAYEQPVEDSHVGEPQGQSAQAAHAEAPDDGYSEHDGADTGPVEPVHEQGENEEDNHDSTRVQSTHEEKGENHDDSEAQDIEPSTATTGTTSNPHPNEQSPRGSTHYMVRQGWDSWEETPSKESQNEEDQHEEDQHEEDQHEEDQHEKDQHEEDQREEVHASHDHDEEIPTRNSVHADHRDFDDFEDEATHEQNYVPESADDTTAGDLTFVPDEKFTQENGIAPDDQDGTAGLDDNSFGESEYTLDNTPQEDNLDFPEQTLDPEDDLLGIAEDLVQTPDQGRQNDQLKYAEEDLVSPHDDDAAASPAGEAQDNGPHSDFQASEAIELSGIDPFSTDSHPNDNISTSAQGAQEKDENERDPTNATPDSKRHRPSEATKIEGTVSSPPKLHSCHTPKSLKRMREAGDVWIRTTSPP